MSNQNIDKFNKTKVKKLLKNVDKNFDLLVINDFGHDFIDQELCNFIDNLKVFKSINVQTNSSNYGYNLITKYKKADYISIDLPEAQLAVSSKSNDCKVLAKNFRKSKL